LVSEPNLLHIDFTIKWATIMAATGEGYYDQCCSTVRPPLLRGNNFSYCKILMQMFIKT